MSIQGYLTFIQVLLYFCGLLHLFMDQGIKVVHFIECTGVDKHVLLISPLKLSLSVKVETFNGAKFKFLTK